MSSDSRQNLSSSIPGKNLKTLLYEQKPPLRYILPDSFLEENDGHVNSTFKGPSKEYMQSEKLILWISRSIAVR